MTTSAAQAALADVLAEAGGRGRRQDPVLPRTGGPAGNARLTAWTGLVLLVLSLAELVTLLDVTGLISWHVVIGTLLLPPALLKTASTGWRIAGYYRGAGPYRTAGPPPLVLRLLGPGVVLATLGLLGSGLALVFLGSTDSRSVRLTVLGHDVNWVTLHQVLFIAWGVLTGLHVLARLVPALRLTVVRAAGPAGVPGRAGRGLALLAAGVVAVAVATLVLGAAQSWRHDAGERPGPAPRHAVVGDRP
ncbi:MAG: hypothetical protein JWM67_2701 [Mycobacterium sp.]|jgi:hypothetical protein|nr:hypothetical protein [Mycobacterium sp.]